MSLENPNTGQSAMEIRVWYTQAGQSPDKPYTSRKWMDKRYASVPSHLLKKTEPWTISTEHGETSEP